MGVESLEVGQFNVRVVASTLPGRQFDVGRALRARITLALTSAGFGPRGQPGHYERRADGRVVSRPTHRNLPVRRTTFVLWVLSPACC